MALTFALVNGQLLLWLAGLTILALPFIAVGENSSRLRVEIPLFDQSNQERRKESA